MHKKTEVICGKSDLRPNFKEIGNNPNFETIKLFDIEGNVVNVNSWLECANYVNGSWTNNVSDFYDGEKFIFSLLLVFIASLYLFGRSKYRKLWSELS